MESAGTASCYEPGDKVKLSFENGLEKEYTVMGIGDIPFDLSRRAHYAGSVDLYLPTQEWMTRMQSEAYYVYAYEIEDAFEPLWESKMSELMADDSDYSYESKMTYRNQFGIFVKVIQIFGISISVILGIIGLINYVNVIYSSIYNRKHELAIMQSMGMNRKQIYGMLITEASYYILISWLVSIVVGPPVTYLIVSSLEKSMDFIQYHWILLPYIMFGIIGCILAVFVPSIFFYMLDKKENLLYRLRESI